MGCRFFSTTKKRFIIIRQRFFLCTADVSYIRPLLTIYSRSRLFTFGKDVNKARCTVDNRIYNLNEESVSGRRNGCLF